MKRLLTIISAAAAAFSLASAATAQEIEDHLSLLYNGEFVSVMFDVQREEKFTEKQAILDTVLEQAFSLRQEIINIEEAGYTEVAELHYFLEETLNIESLWQHIDGSITYTKDDKTGVITQIEVQYHPLEAAPFALARTADGEETKITSVEQGIAHALANIKTGMTDVEKALVLHDYIVRECDYYPGTAKEHEEIAKKNPEHSMFKPEGVFIERYAVCQGYAIAYSQLLFRSGITSCIVVSDDMNHAWNMVKIGENWYHVDVTWDDPSNMRGGYVYHKYFLKSDAEFSDENLAEGELHYNWRWEYDLFPGINWVETPKAEHSGSFENYAFREIMIKNGSAVKLYQPRLLNYLDGKYYTLLHESYGPGEFYENSSILAVTNIDGTDRTIIKMDEIYDYLMVHNGKLYASRDNHIAEIDKNGSNVRYLVFEREGRIVNFWNKLDSLSYKTIRNGKQIECKLDPDANVSAVKDGIRYALYEDGTAAIIGYKNPENVDVLTIPSEINGYKVTVIGSRSFSRIKTINKVVIPNSVEKIGKNAFSQSSITEIELPVGLKTIESMAFWNCNGIKHIEIPVTVHDIGDKAFYQCFALRDVTFHGVTPDKMGKDVFAECGYAYVDQNNNRVYPFKLLLNPHRKSWNVVEADGKKTWTDAYGAVYNVDYYKAPALGDADGDSAVTKADVSAVSDYFFGKASELPDPEWADIDGHDGVTRKDAMLIARYQAGWNNVKEYFE